MKAGVDLDDESLRKADEIDDIWPDRVLATEPTTVEPAIAQPPPQ